jgi:hypothetical protein
MLVLYFVNPLLTQHSHVVTKVCNKLFGTDCLKYDGNALLNGKPTWQAYSAVRHHVFRHYGFEMNPQGDHVFDLEHFFTHQQFDEDFRYADVENDQFRSANSMFFEVCKIHNVKEAQKLSRFELGSRSNVCIALEVEDIFLGGRKLGFFLVTKDVKVTSSILSRFEEKEVQEDRVFISDDVQVQEKMSAIEFKFPYWKNLDESTLMDYEKIGPGKYDARVQLERFSRLIECLRANPQTAVQDYYKKTLAVERPVSKACLGVFEELKKTVSDHRGDCGVEILGDGYRMTNEEILRKLLWFDRSRSAVHQKMKLLEKGSLQSVDGKRVADVWDYQLQRQQAEAQNIANHFRALKGFRQDEGTAEIVNFRKDIECYQGTSYQIRLRGPLDLVSNVFEVDDDGVVYRAKDVWNRNMGIKNCIFVPTYKRALTARLDYRFAMKSALGKSNRNGFHYLRILVIRESDLESYAKIFEKSDIFLILPSQLQVDCPATGEQEVVSVENGGIGFARRCIQEFSHSVGFHFVWMIDDNVTSCFRITERVESSDPCHVKVTGWEPCSFWDVFRGVESFLDDNETKMKVDRKVMAIESECKKLGLTSRSQAIVKSVRDLTEGSDTFGVLGVRRDFRYWASGAENSSKIHQITHSVYSMVLMNIRATMEKKLFYPVRQFSEDLEFNYLCHENGLKVLKTNAFLHVKPNYHSSMESNLKEHAEIIEDSDEDEVLQVMEDDLEVIEVLDDENIQTEHEDSELGAGEVILLEGSQKLRLAHGPPPLSNWKALFKRYFLQAFSKDQSVTWIPRTNDGSNSFLQLNYGWIPDECELNVSMATVTDAESVIMSILQNNVKFTTALNHLQRDFSLQEKQLKELHIFTFAHIVLPSFVGSEVSVDSMIETVKRKCSIFLKCPDNVSVEVRSSRGPDANGVVNLMHDGTEWNWTSGTALLFSLCAGVTNKKRKVQENAGDEKSKRQKIADEEIVIVE